METIIIVCAGVTTITGAIVAVNKLIIKPIHDITNKFNEIDKINEGLHKVMKAQAQTMEHLITGNNIDQLRKEFETNLFVPGTEEGMNVELDKAFRLKDFIVMGELIAFDALNRNESCGGHFREEYQTEEGEAKRDDENFFYVGY